MVLARDKKGKPACKLSCDQVYWQSQMKLENCGRSFLRERWRYRAPTGPVEDYDVTEDFSGKQIECEAGKTIRAKFKLARTRPKSVTAVNARVLQRFNLLEPRAWQEQVSLRTALG